MDRRIHKVVRAISDDVGHSWSVSKMAEIAQVSAGYFPTLFKQETSSTPRAFLRQVRMTDAARRLGDPDCILSVKEIASLVGCPDESHFTKDFKKHSGLTPTEFRKKADQEFQAKCVSAMNLRFGQEIGDSAND